MRLPTCFVILVAVVGCRGDDLTHTYTDKEEVTIWLNKVGPYHNPQETYNFYDLPFCQPEGKTIKHKSSGLGVILGGNDLSDSGLRVHFKENQINTKVCELSFTEESAAVLKDAVKNHYWYQMYIDELPIWGMVGEYMQSSTSVGTEGQQEQGFIYTHKEFSVLYNGDQIIEVNLVSEVPKPIIAGQTHTMTYSVMWHESTKSFTSRFDRYLDFDFFEHQIHWFSIFNSFMMVVFLCGLVALILMRTLRNDYARYAADDDDMELERVVDESGWKQVHGDVFRPPRHLVIHSAIVGTGFQLFYLGLSAIVFTLLGRFYDERGTIITIILACYALTSFAAGYSSAGIFKRAGGEDWKRVMIVTGLLFPGLVFCLLFLLNIIAMAYQSRAQVAITTMLYMFFIWLIVSCPLLLLGTLVGRSVSKHGDFPCRVNTLQRPIPNAKWYTKPIPMALFSGVLPFGSIFIEMYFVFTSFWNYKFYYVYGFMLLVFCILLIVTVCVAIVATYFLLNAEDWRWQWTSYLCGGSTAFYVYLYSVYYFYSKTRMSGLLQTSYYFGYMGLFCSILFLLCGTIGHAGASIFVRKIYQGIKSD